MERWRNSCPGTMAGAFLGGEVPKARRWHRTESDEGEADEERGSLRALS